MPMSLGFQAPASHLLFDPGAVARGRDPQLDDAGRGEHSHAQRRHELPHVEIEAVGLEAQHLRQLLHEPAKHSAGSRNWHPHYAGTCPPATSSRKPSLTSPSLPGYYTLRIQYIILWPHWPLKRLCCPPLTSSDYVTSHLTQGYDTAHRTRPGQVDRLQRALLGTQPTWCWPGSRLPLLEERSKCTFLVSKGRRPS